MTDVSNYKDLIDSRDVISRIDELTEELAAYPSDANDEMDQDGEAMREELDQLKNLAEEASNYASDWGHGETLIRDSYFKEYAMDLADDIGAVSADAHWPNSCIDWDQAARELQVDYTAIDFGGVAYWIR